MYDNAKWEGGGNISATTVKSSRNKVQSYKKIIIISTKGWQKKKGILKVMNEVTRVLYLGFEKTI